MIREVIKEAFTVGYAGSNSGVDIERSYEPYKKSSGKGTMQISTPGYTSKEARAIVEKLLKQHSKMLKKLKYNLIKDWLQLAKSGKADWFDVNRILSTGDIRRAEGNELEFMQSIMLSDKVENAFRRYYKGKKGMPTRKWK